MDERLQGLADELREMLNPNRVEDVKLIQKGMMLYRQGMVSSLRYDRDVVRATVQDVTPAKVELDLLFSGLSECSCPTEGFCRHLVAVFFSAYSQYASVADWVEDWREPVREQSNFAKWGLERAKDLVRANGLLKPDYDRWVQSFEESFDSLLKSKKFTSPYVVVELFEVYQRRLKAGAPLESEWRLLYELIGNVFSFKKLARLSEELGHTEEMVKRSYLHLFHQMVEEAEELIYKIGVQTHPFAFDEFVVRLKDDSFALLTCAVRLDYERFYFYRHLWTHLFKKKEWREEECRKIKEWIPSRQEWENPVPPMVAGIHQYVMLGDDELALDLIDSIEDQWIAPYMLFWIDWLTAQKEWKRVGPMVESFLQKARGYLESVRTYQACSNFTRMAIKSIGHFCRENARMDLYEKALLQTLPYSFYEYEFLLFDRGQFERWGELHSFIGFQYSDLPKDRIKLVEKENPEVLLALLHQSAQHEINLKNRQSYKVAVRHLKKLRTLYKKAKRVDDWQFFLDSLMEKTKRLRAFHEECRRSKLIDA